MARTRGQSLVAKRSFMAMLARKRKLQHIPARKWNQPKGLGIGLQAPDKAADWLSPGMQFCETI